MGRGVFSVISVLGSLAVGSGQSVGNRFVGAGFPRPRGGRNYQLPIINWGNKSEHQQPTTNNKGQM